jgi:xanthine dehydrogenase YagR molybdenum-binding subunit
MNAHHVQAPTPAVPLASGSWTPADGPDPLIRNGHGLIDAQVARLDGPLKVAGEARFAAEFPLEGMVYATLVHSTVAKGRVAKIETTAAEAAPGVVLVMTHHNAPRLRPLPLSLTGLKATGPSSVQVLQDDRIFWNGQPVAVVLAGTQEQADHAASLVDVTYEREPAMTVFEHAKSHTRVPDHLVFQPSEIEIGDAEAALVAAAHNVDLTFRTPRQNHNAIELHAVTLAWNGDELMMHDAQQALAQTAWTIAECFGLDEGHVHVSSPFVGGGFGGKLVWFHHVAAAAAAKLARRAVRMTLPREGVYRIVGGRANTEQRVAIGAEPDGRFSAVIHTGVSAITAHNTLAEPFTFPVRHLYAAGNLEIGQRVADMDMVANTYMRAPGDAVGTFALECAVDELAERLGMDPIALRIRNEPEQDPTSGLPFSARHLVEAYRAGAARFGWEARSTTPGSCRDGEWRIGMGCATATYHYARMPGGAARIALNKVGHVTVEVPAHEMGMGTATTQTIVTAERLGLPMERVTVAYGDSSFPGAILAAASSQTASIGAAVIAAQRALVSELLQLTGDDSPLAGLTADRVGARDGGLCDLENPDRFETYASILARAERDEVIVEGVASDPTEMQHWSMHSFGAIFCEAWVNAVTGETRVRRLLGSFDCGRILNPKGALSQFRGGMVMGIGLALMEETHVDERTGRIMNPSLAEYHVPVHMDIPDIDVIWTDIPDPHAPMGARGIGEIGTTGVAAAVANAVHNATGRRIRELPITPDKLLP